MAGFSDSMENSLLLLLLCAKPIALIADNATVTPSTSLYLSLHTTDPGDAGTQGTNEGGYSAYLRVPVARTTGGFIVTGNSGSPVASVTFAACTTASTVTMLWAAIGMTSVASSGIIIASGPITPGISLGAAVTPILTTGSSFTLD